MKNPKEDILVQLQHLALNLIQVTELEKSGVRDGGGYWIGSDPILHCAEEIAQVARELRGLDPEDPQDGEPTPCLILSGGHERGTATYPGKVRFHRSPEDNVEVLIPNGMRWNTALVNLQKVLSDLEFMINSRLDTTIETVGLVADEDGITF